MGLVMCAVIYDLFKTAIGDEVAPSVFHLTSRLLSVSLIRRNTYHRGAVANPAVQKPKDAKGYFPCLALPPPHLRESVSF